MGQGTREREGRGAAGIPRDPAFRASRGYGPGLQKCPRCTAATFTTLTAATGEVLTEFVGSCSAHLGHAQVYGSPEGWSTGFEGAAGVRPASLPSPPGILEVLDLVSTPRRTRTQQNGEDIEADDLPRRIRRVRTAQPSRRRALNFSSFPPSHGLCGNATLPPAPGLHLDEGEYPPARDDKVQLTRTVSPVARQNFPPLPLEVCRRAPLSLPPPIMSDGHDLQDEATSGIRAWLNRPPPRQSSGRPETGPQADLRPNLRGSIPRPG
jgi:hypothetical protein